MKDKYSDGKFTFSIIKHYNSPNEAITGDGVTVYRSEKLYVPEWGSFVRVSPYDNHFIYEDTSKKVGRWTFMCTCSSPAVITGYNAYKKDASNSGAMAICLSHAQYGKHADGSS